MDEPAGPEQHHGRDRTPVHSGFVYIDQPEQLDGVMVQLRAAESCALDTEFVKVNSFYPALGLLQINIDGCAYVIDGKLPLQSFWPVLFALPQVVVHACSEDLDLIYHQSGERPLMNVLDTQIGLSFLGHGLQLGYQPAVQQFLGLSLDKGETRSDWLARPLRPEQLQYAANDVIYLPVLAQRIIEQLDQRQLLAMVQEDSQTLAIECATEVPLIHCYLDHAHPRHSRRQLAQLQQLCMWREQLAQSRNQPRNFILKSSTLAALIEQQPRNLFALQKIRDLHPLVLREHGRTLLDLLHHLPDTEHWPERLARPPRVRSAELGREIDRTIHEAAHHLQVPEPVLMRRKWLNALLTHVATGQEEDALPLALLGWRYEALTLPLLELLGQEADWMVAGNDTAGLPV